MSPRKKQDGSLFIQNQDGGQIIREVRACADKMPLLLYYTSLRSGALGNFSAREISEKSTNR